MNNTTSKFYITGGTLPPNAPSYVIRQADEDIYQTLTQGEYCYVLDSSQMGKSSLVSKVADKLRQEEVKVVNLSLTDISGTSSTAEEQWYYSLLSEIGNKLVSQTSTWKFWRHREQKLPNKLLQFWEEHPKLTPSHRWAETIRQVLLFHYPQQPMVIFLDEIGAVRSLPAFTDDFLEAIRGFYNARAQEPQLQRLTFCLIGTAIPSDLIKSPHLPSFNIGKRIQLRDFTWQEVSLLETGLRHKGPSADSLLERIWSWTNGHPYLTQKFCEAVANDRAVTRPLEVDRICETTFLSRPFFKDDSNLQYVHNSVKSSPDPAGLLTLYSQVLFGQKVLDDDTNELIHRLRLTGLVRVAGEYLEGRNRIYCRVFNQTWIEDNLPSESEHDRYLRDHVWEHVSYYNTYAKRWGIMVGVGELTPQQVQKRATSYKFIRKGRRGPVQKVQAVNRTDELNPRHGVGSYLKQSPLSEPQFNPLRECQWEFILNATGGIVYEKAYNRDNQLVWGLVYSPAMTGELTNAHYVGPNGFPQPQRKTAAEFIKFEYSEHGDEIAIYYVDRDGKPQLGPSKVFGKQQKFDERGLLAEEILLDSDKKPMNGENGYAIGRASYNELGNAIEAAVFDVRGAPISHNQGWHRYTRKYDDCGNLIEILLFDVAGKPTENWHKRTIQYDEYGNSIESTVFGIDGQPVLYRDGYHKWISQFDTRGNEVETVYFGLEGQPILQKDGVHKKTSQFDTRGNKVETACFGIDGQPILQKEGLHKWTSQFDARGNQIETAVFGIDGQPILHKDGVHKWTAQFNARGNQIETAVFGIDGQPVLQKDGFHKWTSQFDARGNQIERTFFGIDGQPILLKNGYHKWTSQFDTRGNLIEKAYFGINGQPVLLKDGFHKWTSQFDARGNRIEVAFFGIDGQPILLKEGHHKWTTEFDSQGNEIGRIYFDTTGQLLETQIVVESVSPEGQAQKLGIQVGDILTHYDGIAISERFRLDARRRAEPVDGPPKELKLLREGKELTVRVSPGDLGAELVNRAFKAE